MNHITIDFEHTVGPVKRMHAVNNAQSVPFDFYGGLDRLAEATVPYSRLHDTGYYSSVSHLVDIQEVFPDFDSKRIIRSLFSDKCMRWVSNALAKPMKKSFS